MIKPGDTYRGNDYKKFTIEKIVDDVQGTWVHYQDNSRQYSCLIEAFLSRFTEIANEGRK